MQTRQCDFSYAPYVKYRSLGSHDPILLLWWNLSIVLILACGVEEDEYF